MDNGDNDLSFIYKYMKKNCHKHARQYHHHHIYGEREKRNGEKMTTFFFNFTKFHKMCDYSKYYAACKENHKTRKW